MKSTIMGLYTVKGLGFRLFRFVLTLQLEQFHLPSIKTQAFSKGATKLKQLSPQCLKAHQPQVDCSSDCKVKIIIKKHVGRDVNILRSRHSWDLILAFSGHTTLMTRFCFVEALPETSVTLYSYFEGEGCFSFPFLLASWVSTPKSSTVILIRVVSAERARHVPEPRALHKGENARRGFHAKPTQHVPGCFCKEAPLQDLFGRQLMAQLFVLQCQWKSEVKALPDRPES